jgi:hypothetical protein
MKTISFFSSLVLIFSIQILTAAPLFTAPTSANTEKITLKDDDEKTTITITDEKQKTLVVEKLKDFDANDKQALIDKYSKSLNLQDGQYTLVIKQKNSRITIPFTHKTDKSDLVVADKKGGYLPLLNVKGNNLDVNYFMGKLANLTLEIQDKNGDTLYSDTHIDICKFHQRYDISNLPYGTFTVQFTVGEEVKRYILMK